MRPCLVFLPLLLAVTAYAGDKVEVNAMALPALSPDGGVLAFEWLDDIWLAPSAGGDAVRLTKDKARDFHPKFTPDGLRIVFSSDRSGSVQIHSMDMYGKDVRRHSDNTEGCRLVDISSDGAFAVGKGVRGRSGYEPMRLFKVDLRSEAREILLFDATAHSASVSPDGSRYLFCSGGEQPFRNGYRGSRASRIHLYDESDGSFRSLAGGDWEARSPIWHPDGKSFYYLSNESGTFNLRLQNLADGSSEQLTGFTEDSVVNPALSADGKTMVFRAGREVFSFHPGKGNAPERIQLFSTEAMPARFVRTEKVTGTNAATLTQDGKCVIFSAAGDLWAMTAGDKQPVRLTETDASDEIEPQLSPDGKTLCFLRDDGLHTEVCAAGWAEMKLSETRVFPSSDRSKRGLRFSPDGARLSWLEATGDLVIFSLAENAAKSVMPCWDMPTYDWSPDGKWLVVAAKDIHSNRDIWIVPADGSAEPYNLTVHPAYEGSPKWSPDGKHIAFVTRRDSDELARLWLFEIGDHLREGAVDLAAITASLRPVETEISEPIRIAWTPDSASVLFQSRDPQDNMVYALPITGGGVAEYANFRGIPVGFSKNGAMFWRLDRVPCVYWGKIKEAEFRFEFSARQDRSQRMRLGFRRIWRTLSERFYDGTMNGRDWPAMLVKYEDAAAGARDSRQFDRVVGELLGELNASHLTFRTKPWGVEAEPEKPAKRTAHPGIIFRDSWEGKLTVAGIVPGSQISSVRYPPLPGETVVRIGGREVDARTPLGTFFNGAKGSPLPIVVADRNGKERTMELIPASYGRIRWLDRQAREDNARESAGKHAITYLPFRRMNTADLRELAVEVYRASLHSDGLILDLRDNSGGRVADELLGIFCQPTHAITLPRGGVTGYPADRRVSPAWDGSMVVLCNGNTFSNAEIFCHAFKRLGRGKLVGEPTNGGVISAIPVTIPEIGELQVPFRGWFDAVTGRDLELNGAVPDLIVVNNPQDQVQGQDPQIEAAIGILAREIAEAPAQPVLRMKSEREEK